MQRASQMVEELRVYRSLSKPNDSKAGVILLTEHTNGDKSGLAVILFYDKGKSYYFPTQKKFFEKDRAQAAVDALRLRSAQLFNISPTKLDENFSGVQVSEYEHGDSIQGYAVKVMHKNGVQSKYYETNKLKLDSSARMLEKEMNYFYIDDFKKARTNGDVFQVKDADGKSQRINTQIGQLIKNNLANLENAPVINLLVTKKMYEFRNARNKKKEKEIYEYRNEKMKK